jgi:hypothetical protein
MGGGRTIKCNRNNSENDRRRSDDGDTGRRTNDAEDRFWRLFR